MSQINRFYFKHLLTGLLRCLPAICIAMGLLIAPNQVGFAASATWNATTSTSFNSSGNWDPSGAPGISGNASVATSSNSTDIATFSSGTANLTVNLPSTSTSNRNIGGFVFDTASAGAYTFTYTANSSNRYYFTRGQATQINSSVINAQDLHAIAVRIGAGISGSNNYSFISNSTTASAIFNLGGIANYAGTATTLILGGANIGNNVVSGIVSENGGNALSIEKQGSGTWLLSGTNTYTGATIISDGTLSISLIANGGTASNLGQSTNAVGNLVLVGGTLAYTGATASTNRNFTLTNGTTSAISVTESGTNLTISGSTAAGNGSLTKLGAGTLTLSGATVYTGATTINAGTLATSGNERISDNSAIVVSSGAKFLLGGTEGVGSIEGAGTIDLGSFTLTTGTLGTSNLFSGNITGTGGLTKRGAGTLTLSGSNTYTGATNIAGTAAISTLAIGANNALSASTALVVNSNNTGTAIFDLGGFNQTIASLATHASLSATATVTSSAAGSVVLTVDGTDNTSFRGVIEDGIGTVGLTKNGSSALTLRASTYTGATSIQGGSIVLGIANAISQSSAVNIGGSGTLNLGGFSLSLTTLSGSGNITTSSAVGTATLSVLPSGDTTFSGIIANNGSGLVALTVNGSGTFRLSGANTYTGATTITAGTLEIGASGLLGEGAYAGNISLDGVLIYSGTNDQTLSGVISGSGALTQNSNSTLTLSGANTYTGTISINAGTIDIGDAGRLGGGSYAGNISNNGTLIHSGTNAQTFSGQISGTGALTQNASSQLLLTGNNSYTGATTISAGTIRLQNTALNSQTIVGDMTINGGQLTLGAANQIGDASSVTMTSGSIELSIYNETISSLTMSGGSLRRSTGTLTLNAASSFTGGNLNFASNTARIITNGTSTLGDVAFDFSPASGTSTQGLVLGGGITVNGGTTANFTNSGDGLGRIDLNGVDRVIDVGAAGAMNVDWTIAGAGAGITKNGTGTLMLTANNTYSGATTINAGTLQANASGALGSTTNITVNGGSLLVTADNAIGDSTGIELAGGTLAFSGNVTDSIGALTLSANSVIDLGTGGVVAIFANLFMGNYTLAVHNWTGTTLWNGGTGNNTDQIYFNRNLSGGELDRISFYSDFGSDFLGTGFQLGLGSGFQYQVIPVPEPETWLAAALLLVGAGVAWARDRRRREG